MQHARYETTCAAVTALALRLINKQPEYVDNLLFVFQKLDEERVNDGINDGLHDQLTAGPP